MLHDALLHLTAIFFCHHNYVLDVTVDRSSIPAQHLLAEQQTLQE